MEGHLRNFIIDKAIGLLESFKKKPPLKTSGDIESDLLNVTQLLPRSNRLRYCRGYERRRGVSGDLGGGASQETNSPSKRTIENVLHQQQQSPASVSERYNDKAINQQLTCTEGPARLVIANDGSKDCIALLVTNALIKTLRDLYEDSHQLSGKQGPLDFTRREARDLEASINQINKSLEVADSQENVAELQKLLQEKEPRLLKVRHRRNELERDTKQLERNVISSKAHIQWVLENAMKDADLFEQHRPFTPIMVSEVSGESEVQEDIHNRANNENHKAVDNVTDSAGYPAQNQIFSAKTDVVPEDLRLLRREAWDIYNEALVTKHKVQAIFDSRQQSYETDLADYQQGFANGIYDISRSDFDRSKIQYVQKVTRALINAEEALAAAKEQAEAVGAIGSDHDSATDRYGCYEESWPESQVVSYLAMKDWDHVHEWMAEVSRLGESGEQEPETEQPEVEVWYADEVDPADSVSQVDLDEYRKDIDRWENIRFDRWEDMRAHVDGPEVQMGFLVQSIESLKRRHSICVHRPREFGIDLQ